MPGSEAKSTIGKGVHSPASPEPRPRTHVPWVLAQLFPAPRGLAEKEGCPGGPHWRPSRTLKPMGQCMR